MRKTLFESLTHGPLTEPAPAPDEAALAELAQSVDRAARVKLGRSLSIRQVDAGSCNGCELEIHALNNAFYDLERFGLRFVASPRHADVLMVTGPVTKNMREALHAHLQRDARSEMGRCGRLLCGGWLEYLPAAMRSTGGVKDVIPVDLHIPRVSTVSSQAFERLLALLRGCKRDDGESLKVFITQCRNCCMGIVAATPPTSGIGGFHICFVVDRTDYRELLAVNHTTSTVGMSSGCAWVCINQRSIDRGYRTPYSPRIRSLPGSWSEARVDGTHSSVWPCRDPACNIGAAGAAHTITIVVEYFGVVGRFNHMGRA